MMLREDGRGKPIAIGNLDFPQPTFDDRATLALFALEAEVKPEFQQTKTPKTGRSVAYPRILLYTISRGERFI
jgi:hypothetical protein